MGKVLNFKMLQDLSHRSILNPKFTIAEFWKLINLKKHDDVPSTSLNGVKITPSTVW